jgi:hypothetical protein
VIVRVKRGAATVARTAPLAVRPGARVRDTMRASRPLRRGRYTVTASGRDFAGKAVVVRKILVVR